MKHPGSPVRRRRLAGGSGILHNNLSGWSLRTREGAAHRGARRQSLHFSVLKVFGRAAIDTRLPADLVGNGAVRYPSGDLGPGTAVPGGEAGAFSSGGQSARLITVRSVVRVHKGPPLLRRRAITNLGM